jgi:hypothetical protein
LGTIITIWFVIIALMVVAGIALRFLPRKLAPVRLRKVSPVAASRLVSDFIASSYETDFGYPSGYFQIERATESEVVATEWVTKGSHFTMILRGFYRGILGLGAEFGCVGMFIVFFIAALATPALLYAALAETLLKYLLRSRITAALDRSGDGTQVTFTLRGPNARGRGRPGRRSRSCALPGQPRAGTALGLHPRRGR